MARLYKLNGWLKRLYRRGLRFQQYSRMLEETCHYPASAIGEFQHYHFQKLLHHCYEQVPYYRDLFNQLRLKPEDIRTQADLVKMPFLTKKEVRDNYDKLIAQNRKNFLCHVGESSGTTGTPSKYLRDFSAINFENAAVWRHWRHAGDTGKKRVTLRGELVVPASQTEPPFWRENPAGHELIMSGYHLSLINSGAYLEKILSFQPAVLYCYPSTGYLLAQFFRAHQVAYRFDAIFTSSETLDPAVRTLMEETFQCSVYDWYGQAERVAAICQCSAGTYHIQEDYSLVELLPTPGEAKMFEVVGSHLFNYVMPLLRYRTNDFIETSDRQCSCGMAFRTVERIAGRGYAYLLTPEGNRISSITHIPKGVQNLLETQFYQETPGEVIINVMTTDGFSDADCQQLIENTRKFTSPQMKVNVRKVDEIPRGPNGKFLPVISRIESLN